MVSDRLLRVNHTDALRALMASRTIPGLALAVIANGQIVQHYVLGITQQTATPLTESSLFQAASLSKPLFAYGVLRLWQQGVLDLDIPLTVLAPGVYTDSNIADITARQVLSHTTGFPNWWETPDTGSRLPLATPGTRFGYSGEGYEYLQRAIERMIGQPLVFVNRKGSHLIIEKGAIVRMRYAVRSSKREPFDHRKGSHALGKRTHMTLALPTQCAIAHPIHRNIPFTPSRRRIFRGDM